MREFVVRVLLASVALAGAARGAEADRAAVWIEGEAPASINVKPNIAGWGHKEFLSGDRWLHLSVDADKVAGAVPAEGVLIRYPFQVGEAGTFEIWDRIGFEFVRSPFEWRVDGGDWTTVGPDVLTTDLMEIDFFYEVAWLKLGSRALPAGEHSLEIRLARLKGKMARTSGSSTARTPSASTPDRSTPTVRPGRARTDATRGTARPARRSSGSRRSRATAASPPCRWADSGRSAGTTSDYQARSPRRSRACPPYRTGRGSRSPATRISSAPTCSSPTGSGIGRGLRFPPTRWVGRGPWSSRKTA